MRYVEGASEIIGDIGSTGGLVLGSRRFRLQTPYVLLHVAPKLTVSSTNRTREANFEINLNEIRGGRICDRLRYWLHWRPSAGLQKISAPNPVRFAPCGSKVDCFVN